MTTYSFPSLVPNSLSWQLLSNTEIFTSPFTGSVQTTDRGGERWSATLGFVNLTKAQAGEMTAFLARLNGYEHRFTMRNFANPAQGSRGGTPLVAGADQTGKTLNIDGATASQTNWLRAGDFFSVNGELKMCVADTDTDGAGEAAIEFIPRLRTAPADNASVILAEEFATGTFLLVDSSVSWNVQPGQFFDLSFDCVEDIA